MISRRSFLVEKPNPHDFIFTFHEKEIYLLDGRHIPIWQEMSSFYQVHHALYCFAQSEERRYLLVDGNVHIEDQQLQRISLRGTWDILNEDSFSLARQAWHLYHWRKTHRYCGVCGALNKDKLDEQALICTGCDHVFYPRISPCIIVLIYNDDKILLARSPHFPEGVYSTLAGFVEPGESLEEAVHREIKEEVGIHVKNLQYFASQPWPFPDSLMIGFMAEYHLGDITIDQHEIEDAKWFDLENLPVFPSKMSISRHLIDAHIARVK